MASLIDGDLLGTIKSRAEEENEPSHGLFRQFILVYVFALVFFLLGYNTNIAFVSEVFRLTGGIVSFIAMPGILVTRLILPKEHWNTGSFFLMGLLMVIAEVQGFFSLVSILNIHISLAYWLSLVNSIVFMAILIPQRKKLGPLTETISLLRDQRLFLVVTLAFILRLSFFHLSQGTMGTDSAFYADFGRAIVEGEFQSSIINDSAILSVFDNAMYISHQAFAYVFAISWMLWPVGVSGPNIMLVIVGTLILLQFYKLSKRYFNREVALWQTFILSIAPIFIFHSGVGYGPEILTLFMIIWVLTLVAYSGLSDSKIAVLVGLLIGFIDAVWFSNFYVICFILPVIIAQMGDRSRVSWITVCLGLVLVIVARLYYTNLLVFLIAWIAAFSVPVIMKRSNKDSNATRLLPLLVGIFSAVLLWRLPLQFASLASTNQTAPLGVNPLISSLLEPLPLETLGSFLVFILLHVTPFIIILSLLSMRNGEYRQQSTLFAIIGFLVSIGTLRILSVVDPSLNLRYLFSDSRFFLSISAFFVMSIGNFIAAITEHVKPVQSKLSWQGKSIEKKSLVLATLLILSVAPAVSLMSTGLTLVHIEDRYGWDGLGAELESIGTSDSVFLVERAREFSWLTGRKSAVLEFPERGLMFSVALTNIMQSATQYGTSYLVMDSYTTTSWNTAHFLQYANIGVGRTVLGNISMLASVNDANSTGVTTGLILLAVTEPNSYGRTARVYEFADTEFVKVDSLSLLAPGWDASNSGAISNSSGSAEVRIGSSSDFTIISHSMGLNLATQEGFILFHIENVTAAFGTIEVLNQEGEILSFADRIGDYLFYSPIGEDYINDIQIRITGGSGDTVLVHSISIWREA